MTAAGRYIFCDIDGTLLYAKGSGRGAFADAFKGAYGVPVDMGHINFAGATDKRVLDQLLREQNLQSSPEREQCFFRLLPGFLDQNIAQVPPTVFPGVKHFLERVSMEWSLGLITGNIRACAFVKLRHAGLDRYFDGIGGYGDDDGDRNRMAKLALERAGHPAQAFLLGDTPSDIEAARVNNMVSVAVCNGQFDRSVLEAEGADIVLDSFEDADELFRALEL
jgi:phosphoglycolate phosphatase-like HAD superfamily hydrolase